MSWIVLRCEKHTKTLIDLSNFNTIHMSKYKAYASNLDAYIIQFNSPNSNEPISVIEFEETDVRKTTALNDCTFLFNDLVEKLVGNRSALALVRKADFPSIKE